MEKGVICRFNAPWQKTNEMLIIQKTENAGKSQIRKSKAVSDDVFFFFRLSRKMILVK